MRGMDPVELPAGPLVLRPWRDDDAEEVWAALQDPEILLWNSAGAPTRETVARFLRSRADWSGGEHPPPAGVGPGARGVPGPGGRPSRLPGPDEPRLGAPG